jgi:hypothetical protein
MSRPTSPPPISDATVAGAPRPSPNPDPPAATDPERAAILRGRIVELERELLTTRLELLEVMTSAADTMRHAAVRFRQLQIDDAL